MGKIPTRWGFFPEARTDWDTLLRVDQFGLAKAFIAGMLLYKMNPRMEEIRI
jgi:hypothetical protein